MRGRLAQVSCALGMAWFFCVATHAVAGPKETARKMYNRIAGVPPSAQELTEMETLIQQGKLDEAARIPLESSWFYSYTLKSWISSWTNEEESPRAELNDFSATVIGAVRDDVSFDTLLYDDVLYVGDPQKVNAPQYSIANNEHYATLEAQDADLKDVLTRVVQTTQTGFAEAAGVMTTRAWGEAYYSGGTNRRAIRFSFKNFLCRDLEAMHDTSRADVYIRRDIDRSPGGDSTLFRNKCAGCHSGMDSLGDAFVFFDFDEETRALLYTPAEVRPKYSFNASTFPEGHESVDDTWTNMWAEGQNASLGWPTQKTGKGVSEYGQLISGARAFSECMSEQVFEFVCLDKPVNKEDKDAVAANAVKFKNGHSFKGLVADTAAHCFKEEEDGQ